MQTILFTLFSTEPTPDTSGYMIAGYAVIFGVMLIYLASLGIRYYNLKRELQALEDLEKRK
jgi:hypothetical protein